jgi:hypothetical protein
MSFLTAYNQLFLVYVAIFSLSLYTFAYSIMTLNAGRVKEDMASAPVRITAAFIFFIAAMITLMWLSMIIPSLITGQRPADLETYTTLVIQALDLGVVIPLAIITGILLLKRDPWGYALASIILIHGITLGTAILSMILFMYLNGVAIVLPQAVLFIVLVACSLGLAWQFYGKKKVSAKAWADSETSGV